MLIIHGEHQTLSRQAFLIARQKARESGKNIVEIDGYSVTTAHLAEILGTSSLFGQTNSIFIENFFSRRPSNDKKALSAYLLSQATRDIATWDGKDISAQTKLFPPGMVKRFDLPKYIFEFLDTFSTPSLLKCLETMPAEQILASLATRVRKMLISGTSRRFSFDQLSTMNNQLLEIDYKSKTSTLPYDLSAALELWTIKLHNETD